MSEVKIKKLYPEVSTPVYQTLGSAGCDIEAFTEGGKPSSVIARISAGDRAIIGTGLCVELPRGYEAQIRSRSGNAAKLGLVVLNSPGTIDSDYRGEIKVILHNTSKEMITVRHGDRIAQMVIAPVVQVTFLEDVEIGATERGDKGLGSTGLNYKVTQSSAGGTLPLINKEEYEGQNTLGSVITAESTEISTEPTSPLTTVKKTRAKKVAESPTN